MTNFHLAAYYASVAADQTNLAIAAVNDPVLTKTTGNNYIFPTQTDLLLAYATGTSLNRLRLNTPKFRYVGLPSLVPGNKSATVPSPYNLYDGRSYPMRLNPVDEVSVEATTDSSGTAAVLAGLWLSFGNQAPQQLPTYRLRGTATITAAAGVWASGTMTMDQTLPAGRYAVVGMDCVGTNLHFARLVFPGSVFRPGVVGRNAVSGIKNPVFEPGQLGVFGEFDSINLPNLEVMCMGACTAQEVFLDLQMLSDRIGSVA